MGHDIGLAGIRLGGTALAESLRARGDSVVRCARREAERAVGIFH